MANDEQTARELVSAAEQSAVTRAVIAWFNGYTDLPLSKVDYEYLGKTSGLCIAVVQAAYKIKQYINGGYQAQFQFQIVYRLIADDVDSRIDADEALNEMGEWAENNVPSPPDGISNWKIKRDTASACMARYDNNAEDHSISMTINYEVY